MHSFRTGDVIAIRGRRWCVVRHRRYDDVSVVDVRSAGTDSRHTRASFILPFDAAHPLPPPGKPRVVSPARWRHDARRVLANALPRFDGLQTPSAADISVWPFQLEPALALSKGLGCRLLIADEVGLGKTIQAGLVISELRHRDADALAIVVCPAGLRDQWREELRARFGIDAPIVDTPALALQRDRPDVNPWTSQPVAIASIDFLKRPEVLRGVEPVVWDLVVFDEAHTLAGRSDRAAAAAAIGARARAVIFLTATPHSGDDESFARLCALGRLNEDLPLLLFHRTREDAGFSRARKTHWVRVRLSDAETSLHRAFMRYARLVWRLRPGDNGARLAMSVLTRRAFSSAASLAASIERRLGLLGSADTGATQLALQFEPADTVDEMPVAVLAAPGLDDIDEERAHLDRLLTLARNASAAEAKVRILRRLIDRTHEPFIVFTEYRDTLHHLAACLKDVDVVLLHGGMAGAERREAERRFTTGDARVLLATDAASEGLNLHHRCRLVVNLELPWKPVRLEQRVGRVDRIGQRARVHAIHLTAAGTEEEEVLRRLVERMQRADRTLTQVRRAIGEGAVADAVIGSIEPHIATAAPRELPAGVIVPDLRAAAAAEAARIALVRGLSRGRRSSHSFRDDRPSLSVLSRRKVGLGGGGLWIFQSDVDDGLGQLLWREFLCLTADVARPTELTSSMVAKALDTSALSSFVRGEHVRIVERLARTIRAPIDVATRRERAILQHLNQRRARMAATLLQPGLFDHRAERSASAQAEIFLAAVARCEARLNTLARIQDLRRGGCELAIGLLVRG